jgi:serine/threonine protein kinase
VSSAPASPQEPRVGDALLAHLRSVVDQPDVSGTRYELVEPVGRGGMGTVWRALDQKLEREVALKVLAEPDADAARDLAARLVQEAKVLARLEHPGIVPVHDVGVLPDGRAYYAMKLVVGRRLDELVRAGITEAERFRIFARIGEAVAFAHARGVIHLDLKPMNIMVGQFGEVLVLDWGLAQATGAARSTMSAARAGTEGFMSPEQHAGQPADARADVYALGRVLAEMRLPGREIAAIVAKATSPLPADRYAGVSDLVADVARFQAGERVEAMPEGWLLWLGRFYRKYKAAVWLVGAYAVLRIGFELVRAWMQSRNP